MNPGSDPDNSDDSSGSGNASSSQSKSGAEKSFADPDDKDFYVEVAGDRIMTLPRRILKESEMIRKLSHFFDTMEEEANNPQGPCGTLDNPFPLPSLGEEIMGAVKNWLQHHAVYYEKWRTITDRELHEDPDNRSDWKGLHTITTPFLNTPLFFELFQTAEFLEMRSLVVACTKYLSFCLSDMTADEIRRVYHVERDLTAEEEEELVQRILHIQVQLPIPSDFEPGRKDQAGKDQAVAAAAAPNV
ncbi:hypothetical protein BV898_09440 [Hypsibius exemplaris]|uniref:SKP1 component dimerisation domain-containing protein n=1 Tax=Hypsibius exemplaris TaxID=2072580 RepID=A0A1W0WMN0_HYPEX|nr:hypothetical protein BV898_09440 [Hypsibius exemplaris]